MPRKKLPEKECEHCGEVYRPHTSSNKYCGNCGYIGAAVKAAINPRNKYLILERDGYKCAYCGRTSYKHGATLHLDHIVPRKSGGKDVAWNLITACSHCNISKGKKSSGSEALLLEEIALRNEFARILPGQVVDM